MLSKLAAYGAILCGAFAIQVSFDTPAHADEEIYHGVGLSNANTGNANLSNGEFSYRADDQGNLGVSTFDEAHVDANNNKPCRFRFTAILGEGIAPVIGTIYDLSGPEGYQVEYDNNPDGHWNILLPDGVAANTARNTLSLWARNNRDGRVSNGTRAEEPACN